MMKMFDEETRGYRAVKKENQLLQRRKRVFDDERNLDRRSERKKMKRVRPADSFNGEG